jgi:hypothetical protein
MNKARTLAVYHIGLTITTEYIKREKWQEKNSPIRLPFSVLQIKRKRPTYSSVLAK